MDSMRAREYSGKSSNTVYTNDDESIDIAELNEKVASLPQDLVELQAIQRKIPLFKSVCLPCSLYTPVPCFAEPREIRGEADVHHRHARQAV